jgi:hypothetical protein
MIQFTRRHRSVVLLGPATVLALVFITAGTFHVGGSMPRLS